MVVLRRVAAAVLVAGVGMVVLPAVSQAAFPGANGKIFFTCRETGAEIPNTDICSMNPDGSGLVNLTRTPDRESWPDVSPDGRRIAFGRAGVDNKYTLWVMDADGSNQVQVTTTQIVGTSWTPDGRIAYRAQTGPTSFEFQTVPAQGGTPTTLLPGGQGTDFPPRFNAAGAWLYGRFLPIPPANTTFTQQILVVSGGTTTQVTPIDPGLSSNQQPTWSPDGRTIAYWRSGTQQELYSVPAGGGPETQLTNSVGVKEEWPAYSPDGTKLIWAQQDATHGFFNKRLVIADANGANPVPIDTSSLAAAMEPVWAPVPQQPPAPVAAFTADAPAKGKKTKPVRVNLRCIGDVGCDVTYRATASVPRTKKKPKTWRIAVRTASLAARTESTVEVSLSSKARRLAAKTSKPVTLKIFVSANQAGGGPLIRSLTLTTRLR